MLFACASFMRYAPSCLGVRKRSTFSTLSGSPSHHSVFCSNTLTYSPFWAAGEQLVGAKPSMWTYISLLMWAARLAGTLAFEQQLHSKMSLYTFAGTPAKSAREGRRGIPSESEHRRGLCKAPSLRD